MEAASRLCIHPKKDLHISLPRNLRLDGAPYQNDRLSVGHRASSLSTLAIFIAYQINNERL